MDRPERGSRQPAATRPLRCRAMRGYRPEPWRLELQGSRLAGVAVRPDGDEDRVRPARWRTAGHGGRAEAPTGRQAGGSQGWSQRLGPRPRWFVSRRVSSGATSPLRPLRSAMAPLPQPPRRSLQLKALRKGSFPRGLPEKLARPVARSKPVHGPWTTVGRQDGRVPIAPRPPPVPRGRRNSGRGPIPIARAGPRLRGARWARRVREESRCRKRARPCQGLLGGFAWAKNAGCDASSP